MDTINSIAIDGPAASGKSTLAQNLAESLGYLFFDTGLMYRAVTCAVLDRNGDVNDGAFCTRVAETAQIDVRPCSVDDGRQADVYIDGQDRTWQIRAPEVESCVSIVAAYPGVRKALSAQQRRIGLRGEVVMVGRDIGTVVLPEARLKVYLDASVEERARRRFEERTGEDYAAVLESMKERDRLDASRDLAPLRIAEDAVVINSDGKDADVILAEVLAILKSQANGG
ncbi:MAG: (d)CMP kinase [Anaerolineae bacterium]|nr:MAG: (d)CMP kinase [Anaerolineae bacterium]